MQLGNSPHKPKVKGWKGQTFRIGGRRQLRKTARRWRFRGIVADARTLGVHRNTLYKVLSGKWKLKALAARYAALKEQQAKEKGGSPTNDTAYKP
jgi:hypothetical protein